jgi:putative iron-dependent peroxidase
MIDSVRRADPSSFVPGAMQQFGSPLSTHAVFLVLRVAAGADALARTRGVLADLSGTIKAVAFRDPSATLTCTVGIGSEIWPRLVGTQRPSQLRPFVPIVGEAHTAPATAGDLLFHIRADRADICFEFERQLMDALGDAVTTEDETACFRYFDRRDVLGFVDGTANPVGDDIAATVLVGDEDPDNAGGTYIVTQKYLHPLSAWRALPTEAQEAIMGRSKADNIELDDATSGQKAHKTLATIVDDAGVEHDILRDNMPFGRPGAAEFGTYFIGCCRDLWVIQRMLERMFIGDPPGLHDRLLDFSSAVTGSVFFAPRPEVLDAVDDDPPAPATATASPPPAADSSLGIGGRS